MTIEEKIKILTQLRNGYPISHKWEQDYPYDKELMLQTDKFIKELENEKELKCCGFEIKEHFYGNA